MSQTREVPIGVIMSLTQPYLLCDFKDIHEFVEFLSGGPVWTHQIPRVADQAKPYLVEQFPDLAAIEVPDWSAMEDWNEIGHRTKVHRIGKWLEEIAIEHGGSRMVRPLSADAVESKDPIAELVEMRGGPENILVVEVE